MGKFIGIGVGPGDQDLLTIKAVKAIRSADVIVVPVSTENKSSEALAIAEDYIEDQKIIKLIFPMIKDQQKKKENLMKNVQLIQEYRDKTVVFLTIGDPTIYATYIYLIEQLKETSLSIETIPGITTLNAISSSLNLPIAMKDESFAVCPVSHSADKLQQMIDCHDNVILMKVSRAPKVLYKVLKENNLANNIVLASNIGKANQKISYDIETLVNSQLSYFSTVILKKGGLDV